MTEREFFRRRSGNELLSKVNKLSDISAMTASLRVVFVHNTLHSCVGFRVRQHNVPLKNAPSRGYLDMVTAADAWSVYDSYIC